MPADTASQPKAMNTEQAFAMIAQLLVTVNSLVSTVSGLTNKIDGLVTTVQTLTDVISGLHSSPTSVSPPIPSPSLPFDPKSVIRSAYEAAASALRDATMIQDKASRAVVVGLNEATTTEQTDKNDQAIVGALCDWSGDALVKASFEEGKISFHRHPPTATPNKRPLKVQFPSSQIRDKFLQGIRSKGGRPPPLNNSPRAFVRRDLTPTELQIERDRKAEVKQMNISAGKLVYGMRDTEIITYRNPRDLPPNYSAQYAASLNNSNGSFSDGSGQRNDTTPSKGNVNSAKYNRSNGGGNA